MNDIIVYLEKHTGLLAAIGSIFTVLGVVAGAWFQYLRLKKQRNQLQEKLDQQQNQIVNLNHDIGALKQSEVHLRNEVAEKTGELTALERERTDERERHETVAGQLNEVIENKQAEIDKRDHLLNRQRNIVSKMLKLEGQLWEKRPLTRIPKFRPLSDRKSAIISVLNLKGGVGKTTITAHLAAAFAAKGYRVLLLDVDLQGSLTSQFVEQSTITERFNSEKALQHLLTLASNNRKVNLRDFILPIFEGEQSGIIPTTDQMAYAETNLTMTWLLGLGSKDTRFLLRRILQQKRVTNHYDLILLDCPPLINTCCTNALVASDYVLIPTTPSMKAIERVPKLLVRLKEITARLNPGLVVAGTVFNRTYSTTLTAIESDQWHQLLKRGQDALGSPLHGFATNIRHNTKEIRQFEENGSLAEFGNHHSELHNTFCKLATEIEERLPSECRRTPAASY